MLKTAWRMIRLGLIVFGVMLCFIALMEIIQAYQALRQVHPAVGYLFLLIIAGGLVWLAVYYWKTIGSRPRALATPRIEDFDKATVRQLRRYCLYLSRYLERLSRNPNLPDLRRQEAEQSRSAILSSLETGLKKEELLALIQRIEETAVGPLLAEIDEKAGKHVRDSMRDVMIFVTLSPYKSIDLAVVIYRNVRMVTDLVKMYNARPALREQLAIFYDIFTIVATVNYIHLGRNLFNSLGSKIPGVGRFLDDIAQGIGAGFLTTITGHAAMQRCRAFTGWNPKQARDSVLSHLGDFYGDVRDVFFKDVWGMVSQTSGQALASAKGAVATAIDETGQQIGKWIRVPAELTVEAGKSVTDWFTRPFKQE